MLISTFCLCAPAIQAHQIDVPLQLEEGFLQRLLREQVYTESGAEARVWDDGKNCNFLVLSNPVTGLDAGKIHTRTSAQARVGTVLGNTCLFVIKWNGFIEIFQEATLGKTPGIVDFIVTDSKIYSEDGESSGMIGTLWDWVKSYVHPRFNRMKLDLHPVLNELKGILSLVFPAHPEGTLEIINSVTLNSVSINEKNIELGIQFQLPEYTSAITPDEPEPTLTSEELAEWEKGWQGWDAFFTHIIKNVSADTGLHELRLTLLAVLLDARQDLVEVLTDPDPNAPDPIPGLFVKAWSQLAPELQKVGNNLPTASVFNYLSFITAANALTAIEKIEEDTGFSVTPDALRRMARMITPANTLDPLHYDTDTDQDLRALFGFGPLLSPSDIDPSTIELPELDELLQESFLHRPVQFAGGIQATLLMTFMPVMAIGGNAYNLLVTRLNGQVPAINSLNEYLPLVQLLLDMVAQSTSQQKQLDKQYGELYRSLVMATAWQESCWRQYVKVKGEITPIRSHAGAVGIMQVNQHVWRGFYDINGLQNDVGYNAVAGSEILHHYLVDYAIAKGEHQLDGGKENLVRATYAMYNGGPKHITRYRQDQTPASLRTIDNSFWKKFETIRSGNTLAVAKCYTG